MWRLLEEPNTRLEKNDKNLRRFHDIGFTLNLVDDDDDDDDNDDYYYC